MEQDPYKRHYQAILDENWDQDTRRFTANNPGRIRIHDETETGLIGLNEGRGHSDDVWADYDQGVARSKANDYVGAIVYFDSFLDRNPSSDLGYHARGVARYENGDMRNAITDFDNAILFTKRVIDKAAAHSQRAHCHRRLGDHELAIEDFTEALRLSPCNHDYTARAGEYLDISEFDKAKDDLKHAIDLDPRYEFSFYLLGKVLEKQSKGAPTSLDIVMRTECLLAAVENYSQAIKMNPNYSNAYFCRARVYREFNSLALKDYDEVLKLGPEDAECYHRRAECHHALRDWKSAEADLATAEAKYLKTGKLEEAAKVRRSREGSSGRI